MTAKISRRAFGLSIAGGASALALAACTTNPLTGTSTLSSTAETVLSNVASVFGVAAGGVNGVLADLASVLPGVSIPATVSAEISGGLSALSTFATDVIQATATAAPTIVQEAENGFNLFLKGAQAVNAIPGVAEALPELGIALAVASAVTPFVEASINYLLGESTTAPSLTTTAAAVPATTAGMKFGAAAPLPANIKTVADAVNYLRALKRQ